MATPLAGVARDLCEPRAPFAFPPGRVPYDIQRALMARLYTAMRRKAVGVFESPTGTVSGQAARPRCGSGRRRRRRRN
jgi:hypothetical protein